MVETEFGDLVVLAQRSDQLLLQHEDDEKRCRIYDSEDDTVTEWLNTDSVIARGYWDDGYYQGDLSDLLSDADEQSFE
jgi:hypothetical protein